MRYATLGLCWGLVAWLLAARAVGPAIWAGVLASPLIGVIIGRAVHVRFEAASSRWRRALLSLLSLYLGATLFGLSVGVRDLIVGRADGNVGLITMWYGATIFLIPLWPLAHVTHTGLVILAPSWRRGA